MAMADAYGNVEGFGGADLEWNSAKLLDYMEQCQKKYDVFLSMSDTLIKNFQAVIDDPDHTGPEADSTKAFLSQVQIPLIEDIVDMIQLYMDKEMALIEAFAGQVDASASAILKTQKLEKVIDDFMTYYSAFVSHSSSITVIANSLNSECSEAGSFTVPDPSGCKSAFTDFVSENGTSGFVPELKKVFEEFDALHSTDIEGSDTDLLCTGIEKLLSQLLSMSGDCLNIDISSFDETKNSLDLVDPADALKGKDHDAYEKYIDDMNAYLKGKKERCEVYRYDPVNMCTGNYINEQDDLKISGAYPITFHRFYNALDEQKNRTGQSHDLGEGWSHSFDLHVEKEDEGRIRVSYPDGSEGTYVRRDGAVLHLEGEQYEPEIWLEEHGEPGELSVLEDGYIIRTDDGSYTEFDKDGYVTALGDGNGERLSVRYDGDEHRIILVKAPNGSSILFGYDENGKISTIKDHTGREVSYAYDEEGRLIKVTMPDGTTKGYGYTQGGRIGSVVRADGIVSIRNTYDDRGRTIRQNFPDGGEMTYRYDDAKKACISTEQNGNQVTYIHDSLGRHICTRYADGSMEKFRYNKRNEKISHTDRNGNTTRYSYDRKGHLTGVVDPLGNRTSITYNAEGKISVFKDPMGNSWHYHYDRCGNLCESVNPLGEKTKLWYENGQISRVQDAQGGLNSLIFDEMGNAVRSIDAAGVQTDYTYDSLGRIIAVSDAEGNTTSYTYDEMNRVTSVTDALGGRTFYAYTGSGKMAKVTNPDGTTRCVGYNEIGKPSVYMDEEGNRTEVSYNTMWKEDMITLPNGGKVKYEYDAYMRLTAVTDPEGRRTSYAYDPAGNLTEVRNGEGLSESFAYDECGRQTTVTDGEGNTSVVAFDGSGNAIMVTDAAGNVTRQEYDSLGRISSRTDALGGKISYVYNAHGDLTRITDANGKVTELSYDAAGKLLHTAACGVITERYEYDCVGRMSRYEQADGFSISYAYDAMGRVSQINGSNGRKIRYEYDCMGRAVLLDDCGRRTTYTYTATGKLKKVTDALGNSTEYEYDHLGMLSKITRTRDNTGEGTDTDSLNATRMDRNGHVTVFDHNPAGDLISITDAIGQKETYIYDGLGRLKTKTDRDGFETSYHYDRNGLVTMAILGDGRKASLTYDSMRNLTQIEDWLGKTVLTNDALGRLTSVTDYEGRKVSYEYGAGNERTAVIYPDGHKVSYLYDERMQLAEVQNGEEITAYRYDSIGRLHEKKFPNGTDACYDYYQGGLLKSLTSSNREGILDRYVYHYDEKGNLTGTDRDRKGLKEMSGEYRYLYDSLGRLTGTMKDGRSLSSYSYDAFGNRKSMEEDGKKITYRYDSLDRLIHETERAAEAPEVHIDYTYDRRGNMTGMDRNGSMQKRYQYDAMNMLEKAQDVQKSDIRYSYNSLGFRVKSESRLETTQYLCDFTKDCYNLLERTVNGETERFTYDSNVISMQKGGSSYYYLEDELGSPMYLTGTDGRCVSAYGFDDFGRSVDPYTGKTAEHGYTKNGNIIQPFAFTGYQQDEVSGLSFAQARYYDQNAGRFTGEDQVKGSIWIPELVNPYHYCLNSPKENIDPNGKFLHILIGAAVGAAANVTSQIITDAISGKVSSWQTYAGDAIGGAAGGAVFAVTGNAAAAGAANGAITSVATDLINNRTGGAAHKDGGEIFKDAVVNGTMGGVLGAVSDGTGKVLKAASTKIGNQMISKGMNFLSGDMEGIVGRGSWRQVALSASTKIRNALFSFKPIPPTAFSGKIFLKTLGWQMYEQFLPQCIITDMIADKIGGYYAEKNDDPKPYVQPFYSNTSIEACND